MKSDAWLWVALVAIALVALRKPVSAVTVAALAEAIGYVESRGDYGAVSPANTDGSIAYGKYQILDRNIGPWTSQVLGIAYTPAAFLADPAAQDAVAQAKIAEYLGAYGDAGDVAAVWFSGRPLAGNTSADVTGVTVPQYVADVLARLG